MKGFYCNPLIISFSFSGGKKKKSLIGGSVMVIQRVFMQLIFAKLFISRNFATKMQRHSCSSPGRSGGQRALKVQEPLQGSVTRGQIPVLPTPGPASSAGGVWCRVGPGGHCSFHRWCGPCPHGCLQFACIHVELSIIIKIKQNTTLTDRSGCSDE